MSSSRMHADELVIDVDMVRRLLKAQAPRWADLPIAPVPSAGTDNTLFRLGDDMIVRLPRVGWAAGLIEKERTWLTRLAPHLPLAVPEHAGPPRWLHGDLRPGNLLARSGVLTAVIDFGCLGVGDPACDLCAWNFFRASERDVLRKELGVNDSAWERGRGWALSIGLIALPYYRETNPVLAGISLRSIREVLS